MEAWGELKSARNPCGVGLLLVLAVMSLAIALGAGLATTPTMTVAVHVSPPHLRPAVEAQLRAELPDAARITPAPADLLVDVMMAGAQLAFEIRRGDGAGRQRRSFSAGEEPTRREEPIRAIRLGVQMVVDRVRQALRFAPRPESTSDELERAPSADPPPVAPPTSSAASSATPDEANASGWSVSGEIGGLWWARPATVQLGGELDLTYRFGGWRVGARAALYGFACCDLSVADRVQGDLRVIVAAVRVGRALARFGPASLNAFSDLGLSFERVKVDPLAFSGEGRFQRRQAISPVARAGLTLDLRLSATWRVGVSAGVWLRAARIRVTLPAPFAEGDPDIDPGVAVPFAGLALTSHFF